ncbi:MAG: acyl-CoA synthetase [Caulobacterales bacterium 32-69-10]|nr:MAG: acyl-CoA synthetase [Caulobacterales bacterium 32-69-10]
MSPTPSLNSLPLRHGDFASLTEALDYAARGETGINLHSPKGELVEAIPYSTLRTDARALAGRMLAMGLKPGDRVAMIADTDAAFIRTFFACQYAGLVPAPMPLPAAFGGKDAYIAHIRRMIQSSRASAALGPPDLLAWLAEAAEGLDLIKVGGMDDFPEDGLPESALPEIKTDDLCYLQFSSGSTRFPLGIAVTQKALMANTDAISRYGLKVVPGDRTVSWLPLYHDMGLVGFLLTPLACQMSQDLMPTRAFARRPFLWLELISRNKGTLSFSPSFGFDLCTRRAETKSFEELDLSTWRSAGIGGDMIRPQILRDFAERFAPAGFAATAFVPSYGMAEAVLCLTTAPLGVGLRTETVDSALLEIENKVAAPRSGDRAREFALCGAPLPGYTIEVRGPDGAIVPAGAVGRIYARGPSLMQAYFDQPEETAQVLSADGWLDTGDLGYMTEGQLVITGRAKDLIIVNGRNIWPQDLEWTAEAEAPNLRAGDVAVFSVDAGEQEQVVALVQCRIRDESARQALRDELAKVIRQRHGLEVEVVLVPPHALPQTSSGKLSRSSAKALYLRGAFAPALESVE